MPKQEFAEDRLRRFVKKVLIGQTVVVVAVVVGILVLSWSGRADDVTHSRKRCAAQQGERAVDGGTYIKSAEANFTVSTDPALSDLTREARFVEARGQAFAAWKKFSRTPHPNPPELQALYGRLGMEIPFAEPDSCSAAFPEPKLFGAI